LTDWFKSATNTDGELIADNLIAQPKDFDGKIYGIPQNISVFGTWYDKALFAQKGWEVPTGWESFMKVNEQALAEGIIPYIHQGLYPSYIVRGLLYPLIVSANGGDQQIVTDMVNLKEGIFKSKPVMDAFDRIKEMNDKGYLNKAALAINHTDSQNQWLQGKAVFIPCGLWLQNEMKDSTPEGFQFGFIPSISQKDGEKYIVLTGMAQVGVAKKAENPEAAKAFLSFIFNKKNAIHWAETTGALPNFKVDLNSSNVSDSLKDANQYLVSGNTIVVTADPLTMNIDVEKELENALVAFLGGDITKEQWADRVEAAAAKIRK